MNCRPVVSPIGHQAVIGGAAPPPASPSETDASSRNPRGRSASLVKPRKNPTVRSRLATRTRPGAPGLDRVASRDRTVGFFLGFTNDAERPRGLRLDASVSLGEAGGGAAPPITAWWPIGETTGRQ